MYLCSGIISLLMEVEVMKDKELYAGLDVHTKFFHGTVSDSSGKVIRSGKEVVSEDGFERFFTGLKLSRLKVVFEASRNSAYVYELLERLRFADICLAHPLKTKAIAEARIKTDAIDSATLAHLLRADLIPRSWMPPREIRELRELVRHRQSLVRLRTGLKNKIHALLAGEGVRWHGFSDPFGKRGLLFLRELEIRNRSALDRYLNILEAMDEEIKGVTKEIELAAKRDKRAQLLMSMPGIGYYSALLIVSEIGDIGRFRSPDKLCSYAGLVPAVHQSGNSLRLGHITKTGSKWLRWILVQCAHITVRHPSRLATFYRRLAKRKGTKIATIATARKMLRVIWFMLARDEPFNALRQ